MRSSPVSSVSARSSVLNDVPSGMCRTSWEMFSPSSTVASKVMRDWVLPMMAVGSSSELGRPVHLTISMACAGVEANRRHAHSATMMALRAGAR